MAKKFTDLYLKVKEIVYSQDAQSLVVLASMNTSADFTPVLAPNGSTGGSTSKYTLQRRKRPSAPSAVANAKAGTTAAALAVLDSFQEPDWESIEVVTGVLKSIGFKKLFNDDYDFLENESVHSDDLKYQEGEIALARKAALISLLDTATETTQVIPAYAKGDTKLWDFVADRVIELGQIDDDYKSKQGAADFVVYMSADMAKQLAKENGVGFYNEAPIAQTGFKSGMSVNGTPVIVDQTLVAKSIYFLHKEALAFKSEPIEKDINVDLGLTEFTGKMFYDVQTVVDSARIKKAKKA